MGARVCSVDGCDKPVHGHGYCRLHYRRWKATGDPGPVGVTKAPNGFNNRPCEIDGCDKKVVSRGLCGMHNRRLRLQGDVGEASSRVVPVEERVCVVDGCSTAWFSNQMCETHYRRWKSNGDPTVVRKGGRPKRFCTISHCDEPRFGHGFCNLHYKRWRKHGDPLREPYRLGPCEVDGCDRQASSHEFCDMHYRRWKKDGDPGPAGRVYLPNEGACEVDGCERDASTKGVCNMHYQRRVRGDTSDDPDVRHIFRGLDECISDDCDKKPKAHGLCTKHYKRWMSYGDHKVTGFDESLPCDLYRIYDIDGRLLYIGITIDRDRRMWQHSMNQPWWNEVEHIFFDKYDTRRDAARAEAKAIRSERPAYNVTMNR